MTETKPPSDRLIRSMYATYRVICGFGKIRLVDLEKEVHVGRTQLFKHLSYLERAGLIRRYRFDKYTYIAVDKYVERDEFEKLIRESFKRKTVYDVAEEILENMRSYDIRGDLFGTCKIHMEVPHHNRMTNDINIVVLREDYKYLDLLLRSMGFVKRSDSMRVCADYVYEAPTYKFYALVAINGVKHPYKNERYFDLSPVLRAKGKIDLEHAVAGKLLMIPNLRRDDDGEDVAYALAYGNINLKKLVTIINEVVEKYPDILPVIGRNIDLVREYLATKGIFDDYALMKIRNGLNYIVHNLLAERKANYLLKSV